MGNCFNKSFKDQADKLLDFILDNVNLSIPISIKNGLLGLGMGLIYLLRNNLVEGDEDEVLENIDIAVFNSIFKESQNFACEDALCYLRKRASMNNSKNLLAQQKVEKAIHHIIDICKKA